MKNTSDMIAEYFEKGGTVTECPAFSPTSKNTTIRVKKGRDIHSSKYIDLNKLRNDLEK